MCKDRNVCEHFNISILLRLEDDRIKILNLSRYNYRLDCFVHCHVIFWMTHYFRSGVLSWCRFFASSFGACCFVLLWLEMGGIRWRHLEYISNLTKANFTSGKIAFSLSDLIYSGGFSDMTVLIQLSHVGLHLHISAFVLGQQSNSSCIGIVHRGLFVTVFLNA